MPIKCCNGCVPPKRTPTCKFDGTCNKYAEAKKIHDALKEEDRKKRDVSGLIYDQRSERVYKALKRRRDGRFRNRKG